jgi:hypothetical protein
MKNRSIDIDMLELTNSRYPRYPFELYFEYLALIRYVPSFEYTINIILQLECESNVLHAPKKV